MRVVSCLSRLRAVLRGFAALLALGLAAADADAFCRTRSCQLDDDLPCPQDDLTGCFTEGAEVSWADACIGFAVQRDGSLAQGISAEQVLPLVAEGFRAWSDASCARGGTPPLAAANQGSIACSGVEFNCETPEENTNLIVFRDEFVDRANFRFGVIALTTLTARIRTGEILDADIEINSRDEDFVLGDVPSGSTARDLRGVINHELGHLLGLSHTRVPGSLMVNNYQGTLLPAADDIAAMCDAYGGTSADPECSLPELQPDAGCLGEKRDCPAPPQLIRQPDGTSCACRVGANPAPGGGGAGLCALALALWRRRRRPRHCQPLQ